MLKNFFNRGIRDYSYNQKQFFKILNTLLMLILFRALVHIPSPFLRLDISKMISKDYMTFSVLSGGAFNSASLMATAIGSYITATIIMQLLSSTFEGLHRTKKMPGGNIIIEKYTRVLTVFLSIITSIGYILLLDKNYQAFGSKPNLYIIFPTLIAFHLLGVILTMFIVKRIDDKGLGNGLSLLIMLNIVSKLPQIFITNKLNLKNTDMAIIGSLISLMIILIVICEKSERKIAVDYGRAKRYKHSFSKEENPVMPIKLNLSGVMPIILAATLTTLITLALDFAKKKYLPLESFLGNNPQIMLLAPIFITSIFIFVFAFTYCDVLYDPIEISEHLLSRSCNIKGISLGRDTVILMKDTLKGLTMASSLYLFFVSFIPAFLSYYYKFNIIGVTSLIIIINVSCLLVDSLDLIKLKLD